MVAQSQLAPRKMGLGRKNLSFLGQKAYFQELLLLVSGRAIPSSLSVINYATLPASHLRSLIHMHHFDRDHKKRIAWKLHSLKLNETNIAPENRPSSKETIVFQPSIFRGELLVSGRVLYINSHPKQKKVERMVHLKSWWFLQVRSNLQQDLQGVSLQAL